MALFYQPSKATEIVLTTLFGLEVAAIFAALLQGRLAAGCPVSSLEAAAALAGCCLLVAPMIKLVKLVSGVVGASVSRTLLAKDPLGKFRTRTKYEDQCWQLWIHATMTALEVYTVFYDGGGEAWMREYKSLGLRTRVSRCTRRRRCTRCTSCRRPSGSRHASRTSSSSSGTRTT